MDSASMRSMLAPWIGGASAPPAAATTCGVRSMLAFWAGGACAGIAEIEAATGKVGEAENIEDAAVQAASCIIRGEA